MLVWVGFVPAWYGLVWCGQVWYGGQGKTGLVRARFGRRVKLWRSWYVGAGHVQDRWSVVWPGGRGKARLCGFWRSGLGEAGPVEAWHVAACPGGQGLVRYVQSRQAGVRRVTAVVTARLGVAVAARRGKAGRGESRRAGLG